MDFGNPKVQTLRQSMSDAYEDLQKVHASYDHAVLIAADPALVNSSDSISALQQLGRAYAQAIIRHTDAVMEWLSFVDVNVTSKRMSR